MLKAKFKFLSLAALTLLCLQVLAIDTVNSGVVDGGNSTASLGGFLALSPSSLPPAFVMVCPQGDGNSLGTENTIYVTIKSSSSTPIPGIPLGDFWVIGGANLLVLCGGSASTHATQITDSMGHTTMTATIAAGGCDGTVKVVCQGIVITGGTSLDISIHSLDLLGPGNTPPDLKVNFTDFAKFGALYPYPGGGHTYGPGPCQGSALIDFVAPFGSVGLTDFAVFGGHYNHQC